MRQHRVYSALRISLIYALIGVAWTLLTDQVLVAISSDQIELSALQTIKDWSFVFISAILIFFLLRREFNQLQSHLANVREELLQEHDGGGLWLDTPFGLARSGVA